MKEKDIISTCVDFISKNLEITCNQIPHELLKAWLIPIDIDDYFQNEHDRPEYSIFMYALTKYNEEKGVMELKKSYTELVSLFRDFQILSYTALISDKSDFKLFDFDNYDNLTIKL